MLVTSFGTNTTVDGSWRITASETSVDLSHSNAYDNGTGFKMTGWTTISPGGWKSHQGWFVYAETDSQIWAYDGNRTLFLDTESGTPPNLRGVNYCNSHFPCAVPPEVLSRLSEPARKEAEAK